MDILLLLAMNGLIWGLIIALIALGPAIIFGLLDIINIAHGDFFMVGTMVAWATVQYTGNFWLGFLLAPLIGLALGALIQRVVIQPIRNAAALSIVATFGLSMILQETARITFALAAFGGVVAAPITTVDFRGGVDILPVCFMAVIIGGLGNLPGTAAAAVLLSFMEGVIQSFADPTVARIASLVLMSAVLLV